MTRSNVICQSPIVDSKPKTLAQKGGIMIDAKGKAESTATEVACVCKLETNITNLNAAKFKGSLGPGTGPTA